MESANDVTRCQECGKPDPAGLCKSCDAEIQRKMAEALRKELEELRRRK